MLSGDFPATYLALPLGIGYKRKDIWIRVVERIQKRLVDWKSSNLSKGGKNV